MSGLLSLVLSLAVLGTTIWVGVDARRRDWTGDGFGNAPWQWVVGCLLLWVIVFPVYLVRRQRRPLIGAAGEGVRRLVAVDFATQHPGLFWWGIVSTIALGVGAFGPWVHVLNISVSGVDAADNTYDGWVLVGIAVLALACVAGVRRSRGFAVAVFVLGLGGLGFTLWERHRISSIISDHRAGAVAGVGWGLDVGLLASGSLALFALFAVSASQRRVQVWTATGKPAPATVARRLPFQTPALPGEETYREPAPPAPVRAAAGWYVDPEDAERLRYWTGDDWAERTAQLEPQ